MRRSQILPLSAILPSVVEELCGPEGRQRLFESRIIDSWSQVVGVQAANYSADLKVENGTLFVRITSPVLKQELFMQRNLIVKKLNEQVGENVITQLRLR